MSYKGYIWSRDPKVIRQLTKAGYYNHSRPAPPPGHPPSWLIWPIERWQWNRARKKLRPQTRRIIEALAAQRAAEQQRTAAQP